MSAVRRPSARELVEACTDPGSWESWDTPIDPATYGDDPDYHLP